MRVTIGARSSFNSCTDAWPCSLLQSTTPDAKMPRSVQGWTPCMLNDFSENRWPFAKGGEQTIALVSLLATGLFLLHIRRQTVVTRILAAAGAALAMLILYFFRDPQRSFSGEPGLVVSAGDGEVVEIAREHEPTYLQRDVTRISVFLSIFDVHVQRAPIGGKVASVDHRLGKFLQAFRPEASTENEHIAMVIESDFGPVLVKQIAGILARRCVNHAQPGEQLLTGQRFGLIKFGSRVDLFLPPDAEILAGVGDRVSGGITPVARLGQPS